MAILPIIAGLLAAQIVVLPSPDFQSSVHVFPQFVDGVAGGRSYVSTLQISATDFGWSTACTLGLLSMPRTTLVNARGVGETNTVFNFILGPSGWIILQSQGRQALRTGSAVLNCDRPVTAHLIYTQKFEDVTTSEATVSAAPPGRVVQLLADQRKGARLGLAIANPFSAVATYRISAIDIDGRTIHVSFTRVNPGATFTRFIDEFANLPRDFRGPILIESGAGTEVYASGLRFTGDTFTAIPAMIRVR
jgi:hypothetical protein